MSKMRLLAGFVLVALGVVFVLDQVGYAQAAVLLGRLWPVAIIAFGLVLFIDAPGPLVPALVTFVGVWLLLGTLNIVAALTLSLLWPALIVVAGLVLLLSRPAVRGRRFRSTGDVIDQLALFSGLELHPTSKVFRGASLAAFFGGITLDLRDVIPVPEGAHISGTVAFGGVTIIVPEGWRVGVTGLPLFGGFSNKTTRPAELPESAPRLDVDTLVLFGGLEVKTGQPTAGQLHAAA